MIEGGDTGDDTVSGHAPYRSLENIGSGDAGVYADGAMPTGGLGDEYLFALRLPNPSADQLNMLGSLAMTFGWDLVPVKIQEEAHQDADIPAIVQQAIVEAKEAPEDPEAIAYMTTYTDLKERLDTVADCRYNASAPARKPFTEEEKQAFHAAGYKSVVELTSTFGSECATVYTYEEVPGLPAFKVTYLTRENNSKRRPSVLRTFTFDASGGTSTWHNYTYKAFNRVELNPVAEGNVMPMTQHNLHALESLLFRESFAFERVRNGTWQRADEPTAS